MNGIKKRPLPLTREDVEKMSRENMVFYVVKNGSHMRNIYCEPNCSVLLRRT